MSTPQPIPSALPANQRVIKLLVRQDAGMPTGSIGCASISRGTASCRSPPSENIFVGDGDFRAIGAEFLRHFVKLGDLRPTDKVLEIGCGIGRMAVPLTQYLSTGTYDGMDVVADGINWCSQNIRQLSGLPLPSHGRGERPV